LGEGFGLSGMVGGEDMVVGLVVMAVANSHVHLIQRKNRTGLEPTSTLGHILRIFPCYCRLQTCLVFFLV